MVWSLGSGQLTTRGLSDAPCDCGNYVVTLPLLKQPPIAVCRLRSSIFTTTKLEDLGGFTGRIPEISSVSMMLSPPSMRPGQTALPILNNSTQA